MKILMIEDNPYKAEMIRQILEGLELEGMELEEPDHETNLENGIAALKQQSYDLLLLDMYFPLEPDGYEYPMCGLQVLDWLEEEERHFPIIITSTEKNGSGGLCRRDRAGAVWLG